MCWSGPKGEDGSKYLQNYYSARYGEFAEYINNYQGPVVVTDLSVDYEPHPSSIASFDYNPYIADYYGPKYNLSLTCGNPIVLKKLLDMIKHTDFSAEIAKEETTNNHLAYKGVVDTEADLPSFASVGDYYYVREKDFTVFIWLGNSWDTIVPYYIDPVEALTRNIQEEMIKAMSDDIAKALKDTLRYKMKHKVLHKC